MLTSQPLAKPETEKVICSETMHYLLSNTPRPWKIAAVLLAILILDWYSLVHGPGLLMYYRDCESNPARCRGKDILLATVPVTSLARDGFSVRSGSRQVQVRGEAPGVAVGRYVDMYGTYREEGHMGLKLIHVHRERIIKVLGSGVAFAAVLWLFARVFIFKARRSSRAGGGKCPIS